MSADKYWFVDQDLSTNNYEKKENRSSAENKNVTVKNPEFVLVSLIPEFGTMSQLVLPMIPEGKYNFEKGNNLKIRESLYIQPYKRKWFLYSVRPVYLVEGEDKYVSYVEMLDQQLITIKNCGEECIVTTEYVTKKSFVSRNYRVLDKSISVGSSDNCDIIYKSNFVNSEHAELTFLNNQWEIFVKGQARDVLVNGKRTRSSKLAVGDIVYIMGLKLIIGIGFISINDENEHVRIKLNKLSKIGVANEISYFENLTSNEAKNELFNRLPRRRMPFIEKEIKVESPPMQLNGDKIPLMLRMGGSMVMGASSMMMGHYTMMLSSVLFPVLTSKYTDKQKKEYENRRVEKYSAYLNLKEKEIDEERISEEQILNYNYPNLEQVLTFTSNGNRLWERRKNDDDFLNIRLGEGSMPLFAKFSFQEERFALDEDPLENKMYELVNNKVYLRNVPIMNSFVDNFVCGIVGSKKLTLSFVKRLIMQVVISHSYDEVKTIFLINEDALEKLAFIKYLPHSWDNQKSFRYIATNTVEALQISERLKKELDDELEKTRTMPLNEILKKRPYYMVFALDKKLFDSMEVLKDVMQAEKNTGVTVVTAFDDLPKECFKIFQLNSNGGNSVIHLKELDREDLSFKMDRYDEVAASVSMKQLANTNLKVVTEAYTLPKTITFLEMFGVGKIEYLNPLQRWKNHNPVKSLAAPVGVGTDGTHFELDLHEKFHGPHGLIAGMTGSGKSEFIITYILSMAINYHPDEVAFLLIDYKGGGLARAFEDKERGIHLPHLVGTITNLDGVAIQRSLTSIQSENMRRQRIFNEIKGKTGESSIDIYGYQSLYRMGKVEEPLPHLFIIADEFAELKQQEPEFMEKLISTARIGRSLGVHLILATQKPAGIVNDQILSNTKFRVCLKVQDRFDSMDMLKRPDGAELKDTGRFYLQVGYNEYFALGQSAWSGAQYDPQEEVISRKDNDVHFLDSLGQSSYVVKKELKGNLSGKSQLTETVMFLSDLAKREGIRPRQLWKEPLENEIYVDDLLRSQKMNKYDIPIGKIDIPKEQKQETLIIQIDDYKSMLIVGEAGSGKTNFIQTLFYAVSVLLTPNDIHYYAIETNGNRLSPFSAFPHCGGIISGDVENDINKLLYLINDILEERKRIFKETDSSNFQQILETQKLPLIIVAIDGYAGISSMKSNIDLSTEIARLMREGLNYGIRFIITANHFNECPAKIRQEAEKRFALRAKDRFAYGEILGVRCTLNISEKPGRGICEIDKECLEMQIALVGAKKEDGNKEQLRRCADVIATSLMDYKPAKKIPKVNDSISYIDFMKEFNLGRIPLGYDLRNGDRIAIPLQQLFCMSLYFGNSEGKKYIIKNFIDAIHRENGQIRFVRKSKGSLLEDIEIRKKLVDEDEYFESTLDGLIQLNDFMMCEIQARNKYQEESCIEHGLSDWRKPEAIKVWRQDMRTNTKPIFVVFESFEEFCMNVNGELSGMFSTYFELCRGYNIYFLSCFYPNDDIHLSDLAYKNYDEANNNEEEKKRSNYIFKLLESYNSERFGMLFGGQFSSQRIFPLPVEWREITNSCGKENYNKALLSYNSKIYSLLMPCGELEREKIDEDEMLIID
ncbi:MAG: type VII secretion protein EssC [Lachnospiraceae bacterium]